MFLIKSAQDHELLAPILSFRGWKSLSEVVLGHPLPAQTLLSFLFHRKEGGKRNEFPRSEFGVSGQSLSPGTFWLPTSSNLKSESVGFHTKAEEHFKRRQLSQLS